MNDEPDGPDWTELVDRLPHLEWQRHIRAAHDLANRSYAIEQDHYYALVVDAEQSALQAMADLEAWHKQKKENRQP